MTVVTLAVLKGRLKKWGYRTVQIDEGTFTAIKSGTCVVVCEDTIMWLLARPILREFPGKRFLVRRAKETGWIIEQVSAKGTWIRRRSWSTMKN